MELFEEEEFHDCSNAISGPSSFFSFTRTIQTIITDLALLPRFVPFQTAATFTSTSLHVNVCTVWYGVV